LIKMLNKNGAENKSAPFILKPDGGVHMLLA
jgi:hypothetical protein